MAGNKQVNSDLEILGKAIVSTVPNNTGTVLTYNAASKEISTRTNAQIIADLGLITATNIASAYYTKTQLQTSGQAQVHWNNLTNVPTTFTPSVHNHDDRYYTETESDDKFVPYTGATSDVNLGAKNLRFSEGSIAKLSSGVYVFNNVFHAYRSHGFTGIISLFIQPPSTLNVFLDVTLKIYGYGAKYLGEFRLSFHKSGVNIDTNGIAGYSNVTDNFPTDIINYGIDSNGNIRINIGELTTAWSTYFHIEINRLQVSYQGVNADWGTGWNIQYLTTEPALVANGGDYQSIRPAIINNKFVDKKSNETVNGIKTFEKPVRIPQLSGNPGLNSSSQLLGLKAIGSWSAGDLTGKFSWKARGGVSFIVIRITNGYVSDFCDIVISMYYAHNSNAYKRVRYVGGSVAVYNAIEVYSHYDTTTLYESFYIRLQSAAQPSFTPLSFNLPNNYSALVPETFIGEVIANWSAANGELLMNKISIPVAEHNHDGIYEPVFTKNTAFNKNFGTSAGEVAEGNHTHNYSDLIGTPTIPTVNNGTLTLSTGTGLSGSATFGANQGTAATFSVTVASTHKLPTTTEWNGKFNVPTGTTSQYVRGDGTLATFPTIPQGTVTSVAMTVPTGLSVTGSPITNSGTLALSYATGYQGYTTAEATKLSGIAANADNYGSWNLKTNGTQRVAVTSGGTLDLVAGTNVSLAYGAGGVVTINSTDTNTVYSAGTGIKLTTNVFGQDITTSGTGTFVTGITQTTNGFQVNLGTPPNDNTTYSAYTGSTAGLVPQRAAGGTTTKYLREDGTWVVPPDNNTTYSQATTSVLGLVKPFHANLTTPTVQGATATAGRYYGVQLNSSGQMVVNVPWVDTNTNTTYSAGTGLSLTGTTFANTAPNATHTGDVTGATVLTIANSAVTHAKYQNIPTQRILGRGATGTGNVQELTLGANLTLSTAGVLSATDTNTTYSAGTGLVLSSNQFRIDDSVMDDITSGKEAHSWGDHSQVGYLTSFTETDPTVPSWVKSITQANITDWQGKVNRTGDTMTGSLSINPGTFQHTHELRTGTAGGRNDLYIRSNNGSTIYRVSVEDSGLYTWTLGPNTSMGNSTGFDYFQMPATNSQFRMGFYATQMPSYMYAISGSGYFGGDVYSAGYSRANNGFVHEGIGGNSPNKILKSNGGMTGIDLWDVIEEDGSLIVKPFIDYLIYFNGADIRNAVVYLINKENDDFYIDDLRDGQRLHLINQNMYTVSVVINSQSTLFSIPAHYKATLIKSENNEYFLYDVTPYSMYVP